MSRVRMPNALATSAWPSSWRTMQPKSAAMIATSVAVDCPPDCAMIATQTINSQKVTWMRIGMPATDPTRSAQEGLARSFSSAAMLEKSLHRRAYPMDVLRARRVNMKRSMNESREETPAAHDAALLQDRVDQLVRAHRVRGHMIAGIDP